MAGTSRRKSGARRYVRFTRWRRATFFRVLAQTGNAQVAAEAAGVSHHCIYRLRRVEAGFAGRMEAARAEADARLAASPGSAAARDGRSKAGAKGPEATAPLPGPGEGLVVRRGIGGRLRAMAAGGRWWSERDDAVFLGTLRATGNVAASARAAGFTAKSAYNRRERRPAFARAWDEALDEAELRLETRVLEEALKGTPAMEPGAFEAEEPERFDPWLALSCLKWLQRRRQA